MTLFLANRKNKNLKKLLRNDSKANHSSKYVINYQHIIKALIRKPGAFRKCKYQQEILPNKTYRLIWQYLDRTETFKVAPKIMLRILKLASDYNCELELGNYIYDLISQSNAISIEDIETKFNSSNPPLPNIDCTQHSINSYDFLNKVSKGVNHG